MESVPPPPPMRERPFRDNVEAESAEGTTENSRPRSFEASFQQQRYIKAQTMNQIIHELVLIHWMKKTENGYENIKYMNAFEIIAFYCVEFKMSIFFNTVQDNFR